MLTQPSMIPTRLSAVDRMDYGIVIVEINIVLSKNGLHNLEEDDQALEMRTKLLMRLRLHEQSVQQELYLCDSFSWFFNCLVLCMLFFLCVIVSLKGQNTSNSLKFHVPGSFVCRSQDILKFIHKVCVICFDPQTIDLLGCVNSL